MRMEFISYARNNHLWLEQNSARINTSNYLHHACETEKVGNFNCNKVCDYESETHSQENLLYKNICARFIIIIIDFFLLSQNKRVRAQGQIVELFLS